MKCAIRSLYLLLLAVFMSVGCSGSPLHNHPTAAPPPLTITPTFDIPTSRPTDTLEPSLPPPPSPTPIPSSWLTYVDPGLHFSFRYPSTWKAELSSRYSGPDGYFEVKILNDSISIFAAITTRCVLEANEKPDIFGGFAAVSPWQGWDAGRGEWNGIGCTVVPDNDQANDPHDQAVLYTSFGTPWPENTTLALRTDSGHFQAILSTLRATDFYTPTPHPINVYDTPACSMPLADPNPTILHFAGLTITEYPLVNAGCEPAAHYDGFQTRVQALGLDLWGRHGVDLARQVEEDNQALEPFGYRLVPRQVPIPVGSGSKQTTVADLYHEDKLIASNLNQIGPVSVKSDGTDFILWMQDTYKSLPAMEVRRDSFKALNYWEDGFNTAWVGSDVIEYEYDMVNHLYGAGIPTRAYLYRNGDVFFTMAIPRIGAGSRLIDPLTSWDGHWILEMSNVVFEDGQILNQALGYSEIFNWHLVNNEPFYFYRKGNSYAISYGGQTLPGSYDDILHGNLCCSYGVYNIDSLSMGAWFYARKGDTWYLVSALYE
jgi:hypothetical protein